MKGALRVFALLFTALGVQRWLLGLGALVVLAGFFVPMPVRGGIVALGVALPLMPLLFMGGLLLRYFISPIHVRLVPRAREQVLGGMLLFVVAIATVGGLAAWGVGIDIGLLPTLWLRFAAVASVLLLTQFVGITSVLGGTLWFLIVAALGQSFASADVRAIFQAIGEDRGVLAAIFAVSWGAFTAWFLRVRAFRMPADGFQQGRGVQKVSRTPATVLRTFLFGNPSLGNLFAGGFMLLGALVFCGLMSVKGMSFTAAVAYSIYPALTIAVFAGIGGFMVVRRSKSLWLRGGRDRIGVFRACEAQAWIAYGANLAAVLVVLAVACLINPSTRLSYAALMLLHMGFGICLLYLGLAHVRGWRLFDIVTAFVLFGGWLTVFASGPSVGGLFLEELPGVFPILVAVIAAVALVLRFIAVHRWRRIDWLVCKPPRHAPRTDKTMWSLR